MPRPMSPDPETVSPSGAEFNRRNALSFTTQPYLQELLKVLIDPSQRITFFVGAGLSVDAGYQTWPGLIKLLSTRVPNAEFGRLAASDRDGYLRQAETILRLIEPGSPDEDATLIREAIYRDSPFPVCGPLAQTLAGIALKLGTRASIVSTNFDDVLETAMTQVAGSFDEDSSFSLRNEHYDPTEMPPDSLELCAGYQDWLRAREERGARAVMHLHGMVRRRDVPLRPLILTESHFLRYGALLRELVLEELKTSVVIFIGTSLNDPDVTGPLWDLAQFHKSDSNRPRFALHVPSAPADAKDVGQAREYGIAKYQYFETALGVRPVFLKSYSQLLQVLIEMQTCIDLGEDYFSEENSYGHVFNRVIRHCHESLATKSEPANSSSTFERRVQTSRNLQQILGSESRAGRTLRQPPEQVKATHKQLRATFDNNLHEPDDEHFGIFVWLRTLPPFAGKAAPYALDLVASSAYIHFEEWSGRKSAPIEEGSNVVAADAVFRGNTLLKPTPLVSNFPIWRSTLAFPIYYSGLEESPRDVVVGAVTLNSTFDVRLEKKRRDVSVSVLAAYEQWPELLGEHIVQPIRDQVCRLFGDQAASATPVLAPRLSSTESVAPDHGAE